MITLAGLRNGLWCALAFAIVACASAPLPADKLASAQGSLRRAEEARAGQFAQLELDAARAKLAAAQAAADKHDAEVAARMADEAEVDAQLAEYTARARRQEQLAADVDASLRELRGEAVQSGSTGAAAVPR
jgi:hypothetical protein